MTRPPRGLTDSNCLHEDFDDKQLKINYLSFPLASRDHQQTITTFTCYIIANRPLHHCQLNENGQSLVDDRSGRAFEVKPFIVDPQITNFTVLESIIVKAFNLNG